MFALMESRKGVQEEVITIDYIGHPVTGRSGAAVPYRIDLAGTIQDINISWAMTQIYQYQ